jgi:hypothetical protein
VLTDSLDHRLLPNPFLIPVGATVLAADGTRLGHVRQIRQSMIYVSELGASHPCRLVPLHAVLRLDGGNLLLRANWDHHSFSPLPNSPADRSSGAHPSDPQTDTNVSVCLPVERIQSKQDARQVDAPFEGEMDARTSQLPRPRLQVTKVEKKHVRITITVRPPLGMSHRNRTIKDFQIRVDGAELGHPVHLPISTKTYPPSVDVVIVHLSDGSKKRLASKEIPYLLPAHFRRFRHEEPFRQRSPYVYASAAEQIGERQYSYHEATQLKPGDVVAWDRPFVRDESAEVLTNGDLIIPFRRPKGRAEWSRWSRIASLQSVTEANWPLLLEVVEGLYAEDVLNTEQLNRQLAERKRKSPESARAQRRLADLLYGQCYDGERAREVTLGGNLIFALRLRNGQTIHLVDSPEYGRGLYVFQSERDAKSWATRAIDYVEARKRAITFIRHSGDWRQRLRNVLENLERHSGPGSPRPVAGGGKRTTTHPHQHIGSRKY